MLPSTRHAEIGDRSFLFECYRATMKDYIARTWGWDEDYQQQAFWLNLPLERFHIIMVDGRAAGAAHILEREDDYFLELIFVAPDMQRRGIGTRVMLDLLDLARESGRGVSLTVMKVNPAKSLYERLGFRITAEDDATFTMHAGAPTST